MKKILVPTDFSVRSNEVYTSARLLATALKANLLLFHATPVDLKGVGEKVIDPKTLPENLNPKYPDVFYSYLEYKAAAAAAKINFSFIIEQGFPVMSIKRAITEFDIDMIIMGTRGERVEKFEGIYLGSVAGQIAEEVECPVLLMPPDAVFEKAEKIVYGLDLNQYSVDAIKEVLSLSQCLESEVVFITVLRNKKDGEAEMNKLKNMLTETDPAANISFHLVEHTNVIEGINHFMEKEGGDLLVMERHQKNILEKIFSPSLINNISRHLMIPLLIMHVQD